MASNLRNSSLSNFPITVYKCRTLSSRSVTCRIKTGKLNENLIMDMEMEASDIETKELDKCTQELKKNMKVKVLFFARARDLAGVSDKVLDIEEGSTTLDCVNKLISQLPSLKAIHGCMAVALNEVYTSDSAVVKDGDELALIPPISGG